MWDHIAEDHEGKGREEPHEDFDFYPTGTFRKPLERQVDEARRIDRAEEVGRAVIIVGGKRNEIRVNQALLNRREERFNFGSGMVRASFGSQQTRPKPPPPTLPAPSAPDTPPAQPPSQPPSPAPVPPSPTPSLTSPASAGSRPPPTTSPPPLQPPPPLHRLLQRITTTTSQPTPRRLRSRGKGK
jgi:hypothetical protein